MYIINTAVILVTLYFTLKATAIPGLPTSENPSVRWPNGDKNHGDTIMDVVLASSSASLSIPSPVSTTPSAKTELRYVRRRRENHGSQVHDEIVVKRPVIREMSKETGKSLGKAQDGKIESTSSSLPAGQPSDSSLLKSDARAKARSENKKDERDAVPELKVKVDEKKSDQPAKPEKPKPKDDNKKDDKKKEEKKKEERKEERPVSNSNSFFPSLSLSMNPDQRNRELRVLTLWALCLVVLFFGFRMRRRRWH